MKKTLFPNRLEIRLSEKLANELAAASINWETSESEIARSAIREFLKLRVDNA